MNAEQSPSTHAQPPSVTPVDQPAASSDQLLSVAPADQPVVPSLDALADQLHSAAIHLLRRLRTVDTASGLTAPRLSTLSVIVFGGPLTLGALAAAEQVRPPTMTRLVRALERDGLVTRSADPSDRRQVLLRATPAGRTLLEEGRARRTASLARRLAGLTADELAGLSQAAALLERLARHPD